MKSLDNKEYVKSSIVPFAILSAISIILLLIPQVCLANEGEICIDAPTAFGIVLALNVAYLLSFIALKKVVGDHKWILWFLYIMFAVACVFAGIQFGINYELVLYVCASALSLVMIVLSAIFFKKKAEKEPEGGEKGAKWYKGKWKWIISLTIGLGTALYLNYAVIKNWQISLALGVGLFLLVALILNSGLLFTSLMIPVIIILLLAFSGVYTWWHFVPQNANSVLLSKIPFGGGKALSSGLFPLIDKAFGNSLFAKVGLKSNSVQGTLDKLNNLFGGAKPITSETIAGINFGEIKDVNEARSQATQLLTMIKDPQYASFKSAINARLNSINDNYPGLIK